mmetsp:Transcript_13454/g.48943  ORF Transcript_13454/g.48943 Transcript_13454/m.48943 type:complete len:311 (+) Transcript_13454:111-1043(+)
MTGVGCMRLYRASTARVATSAFAPTRAATRHRNVLSGNRTHLRTVKVCSRTSKHRLQRAKSVGSVGAPTSHEESRHHLGRMTATEKDAASDSWQHDVSVGVVDVRSQPELTSAIAYLRAISFYVLPEDRAWNAPVYHRLKADHEVERLVKNKEEGKIEECPIFATIRMNSELDETVDQALQVKLNDGTKVAVVGTMDVTLDRITAVLGKSITEKTPSFLSNVCVAPFGRRRGVARKMIEAARRQAHAMGAEALYVEPLAANEQAVRLYEKAGFVLLREESANQAHLRGQCLDGVNGQARVAIFKDSKFSM